MYILLKNDGSTYYLKNGATYLFGRKEADFILDDKTVSKKHAKIIVKNKIVVVEDLNSSNKTYVNGSSIVSNEETVVRVGSQIRFGVQDSSFILKQDDLNVTMSGLDRADKLILNELVKKMSGIVIPNWSPHCTHIVVNEIVLTLKVLCALINKQPIVTMDYFKKRLERLEKNAPLPRVHNFRPKLSEEKVHRPITMDYDIDRTRLFKNKIFVFPSVASKKKMESMVKLAGGTSVSFDINPVRRKDLLDQKVEYVFVITPENTQSEESDFNDCLKFLKLQGKRSIPNDEIAMAILIGSCEIECNSSFNKLGHLMSAKRPQLTLDVLAMETQTQSDTQSSDVSNCSRKVIPNSLSYCGESSKDVMEVESGTKRGGPEYDRNVKKSKIGESSTGSLKDSSINKPNSVQTRMDSFLKKYEKSGISITVVENRDQDSVLNDVNSENFMTASCSQASKRKSEELPCSTPKKSKFNLKSFGIDIKSQNSKTIETKDQSEKKILEESDDLPNTPLKINTNKKPFSSANTSNSREKSDSCEINKLHTQLPEKLQSEKESSNSLPNTPLRIKTIKRPFSTANSHEKPEMADTSKLHAKKLRTDASARNCIQNVLTSTVIHDKSLFNVTAISDISFATNCNRWLNNETVSNTVNKVVMEEIIDEQMQKFIKSFQTNVVIMSSKTMIVQKPKDISFDKSNSTLNGSRNFKMFRKVKPKAEQTTIILKSTGQKVVCKLNGFVDKIDDEEEVNQPIINTQPVKQTGMTKFKFMM